MNKEKSEIQKIDYKRGKFLKENRSVLTEEKNNNFDINYINLQGILLFFSKICFIKFYFLSFFSFSLNLSFFLNFL